MEYLQIALVGAAAGLLLGMPVGPNGTLCLCRSIRYGWKAGMATASGSLVCIALYAALTHFFAGSFIAFDKQEPIARPLSMISGGIMISIGAVFFIMIQRQKNTQSAVEVSGSFSSNFFSAMAISLFNPKNIVGFSSFWISNSLLIPRGETLLLGSIMFGAGCLTAGGGLYFILIALAVSARDKLLACFLPALQYLVVVMFLSFGVARLR